MSIVSSPWWDDRPLYIVGGGPSLKGKDLSCLRERGRVLGVNRAADYIPCDATFTIDGRWAENAWVKLATWAREGQEVFVALAGEPRGERIPGVQYIPAKTGAGGLGIAAIHGKHSGQGAVNLAVLKRAKRIVLLGFDLVPDPKEPMHWHDGYPWDSNSRIYWRRWADAFDRVVEMLPEGVEIVNANPRSAVRSFPFSTYEEVLG